MKIKKFITINEQVKENVLYLILDFNEALQPILKIRDTNVILPISTNLVIDVLETADINNKRIMNPYSIVQNDAEEFVKLVMLGSPEYKKIINSKTIATNKIKQGTLVKLQSEERLIFLQTVRLCKQYYLKRIQDFYDRTTYRTREYSENDIKKLFKTYNLFFDPVRQIFQLFEIGYSNKRVLECYDVVPEYNENNFNIKDRFNLNGYLCMNKLSFIQENNQKRINVDITHNVVQINSRLVYGYSFYIAFDLSELKPLLQFVERKETNENQ